MEEFSAALSKDVNMVPLENLTVTPGRLTVNTLRDRFSTLENEFVDLKLMVDEQFANMPQTDDSEIKDKIKQFDNTLKVQAKSCTDKLEGSTTRN